MRFLSARRFESNHQPILVHINADQLLRNHHAVIVCLCAAGTWLVVLGAKMLIHRSDNDVFDVGCGKAGDRSNRYRLGLSLEVRQRDVIAIADSSFGGVGRDHAVARIVVQQARQEMVGFGFGVISRPLRSLRPIFSLQSLHPKIPRQGFDGQCRSAAGRNDRDAVYPPVFAIADGFCCGLSGIEAEDCSLASLRQIFLTLPAAGAQRSVLGGKIADTRRPGPPPVGGGTRLWYSCYDIFLREGQPMTHGTPPFSADAALRHFRSYFTEPKVPSACLRPSQKVWVAEKRACLDGWKSP